jgi:lysylphosphatidylglycerol synthetase-like protein (DUF2156 family)
MPRVRVESLLAAAAALVGVVALVSGLTPEFADRSRLIRGVLPPGFPEIARVLTLAFGLALLLLSRSLARGRRRAWQLALFAVGGVALAHLAKGLDFEEAIISSLLVIGLLRYRSHFDAPGDPAVRRPVLGALLALAGVVGIGVVLSTRDIPDRVGNLITITAVFFGLRASRWRSGTAPGSWSIALVGTVSPSSRSGAIRATTSRIAATPSSPTVWSAARR